MATFDHVLVPVDLGSRSSHTVHHADEIARSCGAELTLMHVHPGFERVRAAGERAALLVAMGTMAESLRTRPARLEIAEGEPISEILAYARQHSVDLIVLGTHEHRPLERLFFQCVADVVADQAACSVLLVPGAAEEARRPPTDATEILCAVDLETAASRTLECAVSLAGALGAHLTVLHVNRGQREEETIPGAYQHLADLLAAQATGVRNVDTFVTEGSSVAEEIVRVTAAQRASLLLIGAHAVRPSGEAVLGRLGRRVLAAAPCPLLMIRSKLVGARPRSEEPAAELARL